MFEIRPELHEGEAVLGEYGATVYQVKGKISSAGSNIRLFLTDQRLLLKAGIGPQRTLPIYAISNIREEKIGLHTMACLEFANGHREWFTVENQAQFLQKLQSIQMQAPVIPEVVPKFPAARTTSSKALVIVLIIVGCALICILLLTVLLGAFFFLM